ncbi:MAG: amidohydrolase family protein [Eubacteriales bacterium]
MTSCKPAAASWTPSARRGGGRGRAVCARDGVLDEQLRIGVTTTEIKSGYGLDLETELKQLRVIGRQQSRTRWTSYPPAWRRMPCRRNTRDARTSMSRCLRASIAARCGREPRALLRRVLRNGAFSVAQSRRVLETARALGMGLKIHADEIDAIGGAVLAGELCAVSAEHLIATDDDGVSALAKSGTVACLLPQTSLYLNKPFARARKMIECGVPVAIASDFNQGRVLPAQPPAERQPLYLRYRMTPEETLTALTLNAACAIGLGDRLGTIEVGKQADLTIWDTDGMEMLCYRMGSNQVKAVVKKGRLLRDAGRGTKPAGANGD